MSQKIQLITLFVLGAVILTSCGETVRGAWRDMQRIGDGTRTVFISE